jgi:hypothetical protein
VVLDAPVVTVVAVGLGVVVGVVVAVVEGLADADLLALADGVGLTGVLGLRLGLAEWLVGFDDCAGLLDPLLCPELPPVDPLDAPVPWELPELPVAPEVARPEAEAEDEADAVVLAADEELAAGTTAGSVEPELCVAVVFTFWFSVPVLAPACRNAPMP